jgi:RNA polymerase sigma-70 factor, ECF subfamily
VGGLNTWSGAADEAPAETAADDAALVAEARHDPAAFGPLYVRYVRPVYRYCYRRLGSHELAEDATSTTFEKAFSAFGRYADETFRGWLFTIADRVVADLRRRRRPQVVIEEAAGIAALGPDPEEYALANEDRSTIREMLAQLVPEQRRIVELRLAGLTGPEIARVLGKRPEAIKSAQFRAYARLRQLLEDQEGRSVR